MEHLSIVPQRVVELIFWRHCWQTNSSDSNWILMNFMNKVINPPCKSLITTSFIMSDYQRKAKKVAVNGNGTHVDVPEKPQMFLDCRSLISSSHPWSPHFAWGCWWGWGEGTGSEWVYGGRRRVAYHFCSWAIFKCDDVWVWGGVFFEEVIGRAGLILESNIALDTAGLPLY